ncbi:hypothetical protein AcW1_003990 [Taiwanofungus camphoratus]|nr:hypothetical protein AcW1_003990 [Antrodia cinnamomea]
MSLHRSPSPVSLPSINELFPEHLLASPPPMGPIRSPSMSSSILALRSPLFPNYDASPRFSRTIAQRGRGTSVHDSPRPAADERARPRTLPAYATAPARIPSPGPHRTAQCPSACCEPGARAARSPGTAPAAPHAPHAPAPHAQVAAPCSFNVLRPHPLTASLENVASSDSAAVAPRAPSAGALAYAHAPSGDAFMASITKARPTFRVQLAAPPSPPRSTESGPSAAFGRMEADERERLETLPPTFSANAYLSAPATSENSQSMQRAAQTHSGAGQGSDEKRHRCPHCNKRFNRPSSLNIHVNTHTGAKPFVCRFPGCNRKFNVNSNMRRHYRNHLTSRRRDVVARLMQPASPPASAAASPESPYVHSLPYAPGPDPYAPHSPAPPRTAYSDPGEYERAADDCGPGEYEYRPKSEAADAAAGAGLRARSSPAPRRRFREGACTVPGCGCAAISTALRPAFPESAPRS